MGLCQNVVPQAGFPRSGTSTRSCCVTCTGSAMRATLLAGLGGAKAFPSSSAPMSPPCRLFQTRKLCNGRHYVYANPKVFSFGACSALCWSATTATAQVKQCIECLHATNPIREPDISYVATQLGVHAFSQGKLEMPKQSARTCARAGWVWQVLPKHTITSNNKV